MPGAGKSRVSKEARQNRERYARPRPVNQREPLPVVVVVCDDTKTAPTYFNALAQKLKGKVYLKAHGCGAMPADVLAEAKSKREGLLEKSSADAEHDKNVVWALIDVEGEQQRQNAAWTAKESAENDGIKVALSKPCFELWTLLHLCDTGEAFSDCSAVIARLNAEWKKVFGKAMGPKAQADFSKIRPKIDEATKRARKHRESNDPSWTEVFKVLEEIMSFCPHVDISK